MSVSTCTSTATAVHAEAKEKSAEFQVKSNAAASFTPAAAAVTSAAITGLTPPAATEVQKTTTILPLNKRKVAVFNYVTDGYGDISCAFKFLALLRDHSGIPQNQIYLLTTTSIEETVKFNQDHWNVFKIRGLKEIKQKIDELGIQFLLIGPASSWDKRDFQITRVPKAFIYEYGTSEEEFVKDSMGVKANDLGIFIDQKLCEQSAKNVQSEVIPKIVYNILKEFHTEAVCKQFCKGSQYFLGHALSNESKQQFIIAAAQSAFMLENLTCNLNFIFPKLELKDLEFKQIAKTLMSVGAVGVRYIQQLKKGVTAEMLGDCSGLQGRIVTIISSGDISHAEFLDVLLASKAVLVTGDQSLSEAISASKIFIYETRKHKTDFAKDLVTLYATRAPKLAQLFQDSMKFSIENMVDFLYQCSTTEKKTWQELMTWIQTKYDLKLHFNPHLEAALKEDLLPGSGASSYLELNYKDFSNVKVTSQNLPFDSPVFMDFEQTWSLTLFDNYCLYRETIYRPIILKESAALLDEFKDSTFDVESFGYSYFLVTRRKKK